jgi:hypothetical protein
VRRFLIAVSMTALAATPALAGLTLGVRAGSSIPDLRDNSSGNDFSSGWSTRVAPYGGVFALRPLSGPWSLQAEVSFAAQGAKRDGMQRVTDPQLEQMAGGQPLYARFKTVAKLDYVEIPVLARWNAPGRSRLDVVAGPYVGFLVSAKTETSGSSLIYTDKSGTTAWSPGGGQTVTADFGATTDDKSDLKSFNWGAQIGVGIAQRLGRGDVTLDARAGLGFVNIQKDSANGENSTGNVTVALGYQVPLGGR